jgi:hypothetical protein
MKILGITTLAQVESVVQLTKFYSHEMPPFFEFNEDRLRRNIQAKINRQAIKVLEIDREVVGYFVHDIAVNYYADPPTIPFIDFLATHPIPRIAVEAIITVHDWLIAYGARNNYPLVQSSSELASSKGFRRILIKRGWEPFKEVLYYKTRPSVSASGVASRRTIAEVQAEAANL